MQVIVFEDGVASVNCERSWADAPVAAHLFGFMHDYENVEKANLKPKKDIVQVCVCICVYVYIYVCV